MPSTISWAIAHLLVAAVEPRRELRGRCGRVGLDVGVHQEERDAPDLDALDLGVDRAARQIHLDHHLAPVGGQRGHGGHVGEVQLLVDRLLPAVGVDALAEVALRIEEADADERQAQIAGLFAVVAARMPRPPE